MLNMRGRFIYLTLVQIIVCSFVVGQTEEKFRKKKIQEYLDSSTYYRGKDQTKSVYFASYVLDTLCLESEYEPKIIAMTMIAYAYKIQGNKIKALEYIDKSLSFKNASYDSCILSKIYSVYASIYTQWEELDSMSKYSQLVLQQNCKSNQASGRQLAYTSLYTVYDKLNLSNKAEKILLDAYKEVKGNSREEIFILVSLIDFYRKQNKLEYYTYVNRIIELQFFEKMSNESFASHYQFYLGLDKSSFDEKEKRLRLVIQNMISKFSADIVVEVELLLFELYKQNKNWKKAEILLENYLLKDKINLLSLSKKEKVYYALAEVYESKANYSKALEFYQSSAACRDSILNNESLNRMNELNIKYETLRKDKEIDQQKEELKSFQSKTRNSYLYAGLSLLFCLGIILYFTYRIRSQKSIARLNYRLHELDLLKVKNQKSILEAEAKVNAQSDERARIFQLLNQRIGSKIIQLKDEIQQNSLGPSSTENLDLFAHISKYLDQANKDIRRISYEILPNEVLEDGLLQAIQNYCASIFQRKNIRFEYNHKGSLNNMNEKESIELYKIIQELCNNIIKHSEATLVTLSIESLLDVKQITMTDNGIGFDVEEKVRRGGIGMLSLQKRVSELNGSIQFESKPGKGTKVIIQLDN